MFDELTKELLDLTATEKGCSRARYAARTNICCCSSCCQCFILC